MDLKESFISREEAARHWYYQSKANAMLHSLRDITFDSATDIGAGSGFFAEQLLQASPIPEAICLDTGYERDREEAVGNKRLIYRRELATIDTNLVLMMDVLEHIEDDLGFLKDCVGKAATGTHFFITVPAFQFLWSGHDVYLEHFRRYNLSEIKKLVKAAGLEVIRGHYYFGALFPVPLITRLIERILHKQHTGSKLKHHHPLINRVAHTICRAEIPLMRLNKLAGLTAVVLARKP
ncbi:MAG: methyltransferase domain-containing protein [Pseudohongiellaceae bacterium]